MMVVAFYDNTEVRVGDGIVAIESDDGKITLSVAEFAEQAKACYIVTGTPDELRKLATAILREIGLVVDGVG